MTIRILDRVIFGLVLAICCGTQSLAETSLTIHSELGDPIGDGRDYAFTDADGPFTATRNARNGVSILFWATYGDNIWFLDFAGGNDQPLTVGTYANVVRYPPADPTRPSLRVGGNHLVCETITGSFEVLDVLYNTAGGIDRFRARFQQFCTGSVHPLTGEVRFNATVPVHMTVPRDASVVIGQELRFGVSAVADDQGPVSLTASGLPAGAELTTTGPDAAELVWIPGPGQIGSYAVTFHGEDGDGHVENALTKLTVGGIVHVPSDYPTIQAAIDAAAPASIVNVGPGTYLENIDLRGKALTLQSDDGPDTTIIDGNRRGPVIRCMNFEGRGTSITGFTVRNGGAYDGGGIAMARAAPVIVGNVFQGNAQYAGGRGAAIGGDRSSPIISGNRFRNNTCDTQFSSGVVSFSSSSAPQITNNLFENNPCRAIRFFVNALETPFVVNNTIVGNRTGILLDGRLEWGHHVFSNNVIVGNGVGLQVQFGDGSTHVTWTHNLVFGNTVDYEGISNQTGTFGNLAADPAFVCPPRGDYRLSAPSAAIDAGDDAAPGLPAIDLAGTARILDGNADGTAAVDIGAFEFNPSSPGICIVCPAGVTVYAPPGQHATIAVYPPPTVSDGSTVSCAPPSGSMFPEGTTTVTCTAHDATGDTESCSFAVTVRVPPINDDFGNATHVTTLPFVESTDTTYATVAADDPACYTHKPTVWYAYTPSVDMVLTVQAYGATVGAYLGSRGLLIPLDCEFQYLEVAVPAHKTVHFMVTSYYGTANQVFKLEGRRALEVEPEAGSFEGAPQSSGW